MIGLFSLHVNQYRRSNILFLHVHLTPRQPPVRKNASSALIFLFPPGEQSADNRDFHTGDPHKIVSRPVLWPPQTLPVDLHAQTRNQGATHVCPALINFPQAVRRAAIFTFAPRPTIQGLFPPNSKVTGVKCFAAISITCCPKRGTSREKI